MKTLLAQTLPLTTAQSTTTQQSLKDRAGLKKACQDFEAIFIQSMFQSMRKTIPEGGLFEQDHATKMYQEMMDQEMATKISRHQSLGLAEQMYRQMEKLLPPEK